MMTQKVDVIGMSYLPIEVKMLLYATLFLLFLVCGVFWSNWLAFSRSFHHLSIDELSRMAQFVGENLAFPMRYLAGFTVSLITASIYFYPHQSVTGLILVIGSLGLLLIPLLITVLVEVPINRQIESWTSTTAPTDWQAIRNRWQYFNRYRVVSALGSFLCFSASILLLV